MKQKWKRAAWAVCVFHVLALVGSPAWGGEGIRLNDAELDQVYGADLSEEDDSLMIPRNCGTCTLVIDASAQANSTAMIIVNALASVVGAQVNVIANMGTVGHATQTNIGNVSGP